MNFRLTYYTLGHLALRRRKDLGSNMVVFTRERVNPEFVEAGRQVGFCGCFAGTAVN